MERCVVFLPSGTKIDATVGETILEAARRAGLALESPCGGHGTCGKCQVQLQQPDGTWRTVIGCQTVVEGTMTVRLPQNRGEHTVILTSGQNRRAEVMPHLQALCVTLKEASPELPESLWDRLREAVALETGWIPETPAPEILSDLWRNVEAGGGSVWVVCMEHKILTVLQDAPPLYCAAVDIGTTTLALYLLDSKTGDVLAVKSALNPQKQYGADVISRIQSAQNDGLAALTAVVRGQVDRLLEEAAGEAGIRPEEIALLAVVGNTCMHHLYLGIRPDSLADPPYTPVIRDALNLPAAGKAAIAPWGRILVLPNIAGFVGADTVSCILSTRLDQQERCTLLLDIGTNGEMVLGNRDRMISCSTAAGPAMEGAKIRCGMRGADGAMDHIWLEEDRLCWSVIGGGEPQGICGSGLLDAVAVLLEMGVLLPNGRFQKPERITHPAAAGRLRTLDGQQCFVFREDGERMVYLCQKDVRELQLAKGAIAAGISLMSARLGIEIREIEQVWIAGAFGTYIRPHSACALGLLPTILEERVQAVGNAAGDGAREAALSRERFARAEALKNQVEFLELATVPEFQPCFLQNLNFPSNV